MSIKDVKRHVKKSKEHRIQLANLLAFIIVPLVVLMALYLVMHNVMAVKH